MAVWDASHAEGPLLSTLPSLLTGSVGFSASGGKPGRSADVPDFHVQEQEAPTAAPLSNLALGGPDRGCRWSNGNSSELHQVERVPPLAAPPGLSLEPQPPSAHERLTAASFARALPTSGSVLSTEPRHSTGDFAAAVVSNTPDAPAMPLAYGPPSGTVAAGCTALAPVREVSQPMATPHLSAATAAAGCGDAACRTAPSASHAAGPVARQIFGTTPVPAGAGLRGWCAANTAPGHGATTAAVRAHAFDAGPSATALARTSPATTTTATMSARARRSRRSRKLDEPMKVPLPFGPLSEAPRPVTATDDLLRLLPPLTPSLCIPGGEFRPQMGIVSGHGEAVSSSGSGTHKQMKKR